MPEKDITEKILFCYNDVFADVVNALLFEGQQVISEDELVDQPTLASYKADGKIRELDRDVAKRWLGNNDIRIACIGIENQTDADPDMVLRVYAYDGAEYRTQLLKENKSKPRYPVVTLVLYFGYEHRWNKAVTLHEAIRIPDIFKPYVPDIRINLFEIAYLSDEQLGYFHSDFRVVADYFVQKRKNNDYVPSPERLQHIEAVLQLLRVMTGDSRFEEVMNECFGEGGIHNMCDVLDRIEAKGEARGISIGEIRGAIMVYEDEMHLMRSEILAKIMSKFSLSEDAAKQIMKETLDPKQQ